MFKKGDLYSIFYVCSIIYRDLYCMSCKKTCILKKGILCISCSKKETYILYFMFKRGDSYSFESPLLNMKGDSYYFIATCVVQRRLILLYSDVCCTEETHITV